MNRIYLCAALALITVLPSKAQEKQPRFVADQVVAVVGSSAILYSEIVELGNQIVAQRREQGYTSDRDPLNEALENIMLQKLLYHQSQVDSVQISTDRIAEAVEERIDEMIRQRGGLVALETFYHKPVQDIREEMRTKYEEQSYAQQMRSEVESKVTVTPGEVERYFRSLAKDSIPTIPEQYIYAQITKFPASTTAAKQRVRERLLEMRERILKGTSFALLARMYSVDGSAVRGGEMDPTPKEGFVKPFGDALEKLKVGQVSEVVETEYGFHLIEMLGKEGNLYRCRHILLRPVFTDQELVDTDLMLDTVATRIRDKEITFEAAAAQYSDDKYSRQNGGIVSNHDLLEMYGASDAKYTSTKFFKEDLPRGDYQTLIKLKPGEVSESFQTQDMRGNQLSKVLKLIEIEPAHPASLKHDYLRIEEMALSAKQDKVFTAWVNEKIAGMYVRIDDKYRTGEFENKHWLK